MRRFLLIVLTASFPAIFPGTGIVQAAQRSSREVQKVPGQEVHNLKKQQKAQRKQLKERQQADRKVMSQHATTKDEQARMKRDQKAQRQVLKNQQKQEMSDMKRGHKPPKPHPSHPPRDRGHTST